MLFHTEYTGKVVLLEILHGPARASFSREVNRFLGALQQQLLNQIFVFAVNAQLYYIIKKKKINK